MAAPMDTESENNTLVLATEIKCATNSSCSEIFAEQYPFRNDKLNISICLLCGIPASGKSTIVDYIANNREGTHRYSQLKNSVIALPIDYDALLPQIQEEPLTFPEEEEVQGEWKTSRLQILSAVEALIQQVQMKGIKTMAQLQKPEGVANDAWLKLSGVVDSTCDAVQTDDDYLLVVIDDNMFFRSMRYNYYRLAKKYRTGYCQVYMSCSTDTAIARNKQRKECSRVPEYVIRRMASKLEPPDVVKYHWEKYSVAVDSERNVNMSQIFALIQESFVNPVQPKDIPDEEECNKSRFQCSTNLLHQADLILRKCVADYMAECKVTKDLKDLKQLSQKTSVAKGKILSDLKAGHISLTLSMTAGVQDSAHDTSSDFYRLVENLFMSQIPSSSKT